MKLNLHPKGIPKQEPLGADTPLKKGGVVVGMRKEGDKEKSILSVMTATCSALAPLAPVNQGVWFWKVSAFWDLLVNPSSAPIPKPNCSTTPLTS